MTSPWRRTAGGDDAARAESAGWPRPTSHEREPARRPLRIGVFGARGIPSTYSGFETFLTVLLPELVSRGHEVTMYCRRGEVDASPTYAGVRCVHLPAVRSKQLSTLTHGWVASWAAVRAHHDVLLVVNVANAAVGVACRAFGQRVVLNTDGQEWARSKWGPLGRAVFLGSAHLARWGASARVADSEAMRDIYRRRFRASSTVIPYCWTELQPAGTEVLGELGLEAGGYLLIAGRLVPENNIGAMASAVLATDIDLPLVVLGTANYRSPVTADLEAMARRDDRLRLLGHVDHRPTFARLVVDARVYLHGHSVGGINPSLIEAMGCGARILSLDTPFNREAADDAADYFSEPEADLAVALGAVVGEPHAQSERRRRVAWDRARSWYPLHAVADAYEDLLVEVAMRPGPRAG